VANPTTYTSTIDYTYDAGNRLTHAVDSVSGTISRAFDGLDRLTYEITPQGRIDYAYDAASRRTSATVQGQAAVTYSWDDASRLTGITQSSSTVGFSYDEASRRSTLTLPNGLSVEYGYDDANQLASLTYRNGSTVMGDLTYTYDAAGRRTEIGGSYARTNLPAALASATFDAANHLTNQGGQGYTYDDNGNLLSDGTRTYTWNARNQLTAIGGSVTASLQYDALGRRISKTVSGATTKYLYDGLNLVQEQDGSGTPTANITAGLNLDEWYLRSDSAGARYLLADALGSTIALADGAGAIQTSYTYEPYGETAASGSASANPLKYTGREDDGTGLYYYRARYYQPGIKRFVAEDPIGLLGGPNLYAYVGGNPISFADPLGLVNVDPSGADGTPGGSGPRTNQYHGQGGEGSPGAAIAKVAAVIVGVPAAVGAVVAAAPVAASAAGPAVKSVVTAANIKRSIEIATVAQEISGITTPHPPTPREVEPQTHVERASEASRRPKLPRWAKILRFVPLFLFPFVLPDDSSACP
jgi:RHS repeat-associated protein